MFINGGEDLPEIHIFCKVFHITVSIPTPYSFQHSDLCRIYTTLLQTWGSQKVGVMGMKSNNSEEETKDGLRRSAANWNVGKNKEQLFRNWGEGRNRLLLVGKHNPAVVS